MNSLLNLHPYSKKAFEYLYHELTDENFKRPYLIKDKPVNAVTGILWDISRNNKELKKIIQTMDKMDRIKAQNPPSRLHKITITWFKKAYKEHLKKGYVISRSLYLKFIKNIIQPKSPSSEEKLMASGRSLFNKIYSAQKMRQGSVKKTAKLDKLKSQYPKLNIETAYRYAIVTGKFSLNANDIEDFESMVYLLVQNQQRDPKGGFLENQRSV